MKKNEYLAPEVEVVEITEKYSVMAGSSTESGGEGNNSDPFA